MPNRYGCGFCACFVQDKIEDAANAFALEAGLQDRYQNQRCPPGRPMELGRRLWRVVGAGSSGYEVRPVPNQHVHKVFVTYSFQLGAALDSSDVIINY